MRTITFHNDYTPSELAQALLDAGFGRGDTLAQVVTDAIDDTDETVSLDCVVDEDEVLKELGDDAIVKAYRDLSECTGEDRAIEDAVRYTRAGDLPLASAMFARVFEGADLAAVERALS